MSMQRKFMILGPKQTFMVFEILKHIYMQIFEILTQKDRIYINMLYNFANKMQRNFDKLNFP